jgi:hypothetical protein
LEVEEARDKWPNLQYCDTDTCAWMTVGISAQIIIIRFGYSKYENVDETVFGKTRL